MIPDDCTETEQGTYSSDEVTYFMQALCKSDSIFVRMGDKSYSVSKDLVAIIIIGIDLGIVFIFFFSLMTLRMF